MREEKVRVRVDGKAHAIMLGCTRAVDIEIGGLALVEDDGEELFVHSPEVSEQKGNSGHLVHDPGYLMEWWKRHGLWKKEHNPYLNFCLWHSHVSGPVFFSQTDKEAVETLVTRGWLVNLVFNQKGEVSCRVDSLVGSPQLDHCLWVTVPCEMVIGDRYDVKEEVEREAAKCKKMEPPKGFGETSWWHELPDEEEERWKAVLGKTAPASRQLAPPPKKGTPRKKFKVSGVDKTSGLPVFDNGVRLVSMTSDKVMLKARAGGTFMLNWDQFEERFDLGKLPSVRG